MRGLLSAVAGAIGCLVLAGCSGDGERAEGCTPGHSLPCVCPGGGEGEVVCLEDRSYGSCSCSTDASSSAGSSGAASTGAGAPGSCEPEGRMGCDGQNVQICEGGQWTTISACPGFQQCTAYLDSVQCGTDWYAQEGAPCGSSSFSCSMDKTRLLHCESGAWVTYNNCPPDECVTVASDNTVGCSNGGMTPGDKCAAQAGSVFCSTDLNYILQCANGQAEIYQDCSASGQKCVSVSCPSGSCLTCG